MKPNREELEMLLRSVPVPERPAAYWDQFPAGITVRLRQLRRGDQPSRGSRTIYFLGLGLAAACVALGFFLGFWKGAQQTASVPDAQLAKMRTYFREINALFPNQIRAVIIDDQGLQLVLAEQANVAGSEPLFLKVCVGEKCQRVLTFSGQQVQINGELCEVLEDAQRNIILMGKKLVWSSSDPGAGQGRFRIAARPLAMAL